jgi:hypothetical protein
LLPLLEPPLLLLLVLLPLPLLLPCGVGVMSDERSPLPPDDPHAAMSPTKHTPNSIVRFRIELLQPRLGNEHSHYSRGAPRQGRIKRRLDGLHTIAAELFSFE